MGLLDKIRDVVDSLLGGNSPKKEYYYFILNLLSTAEYLKKEHIKKCYKEKMGRDFDDAVLETVLTKFQTIKDRETGGVWYERTKKQVFDEKIPKEAWLFQSKDEIYDICFGDFRKEIRVRFEETLESIKTCATEYDLEAAWDLKSRDYPSESQYHHSIIAAQVMADVMIEHFYENDPTVIAIVLREGLGTLRHRYKCYREGNDYGKNLGSFYMQRHCGDCILKSTAKKWIHILLLQKRIAKMLC